MGLLESAVGIVTASACGSYEHVIVERKTIVLVGSITGVSTVNRPRIQKRHPTSIYAIGNTKKFRIGDESSEKNLYTP